MCIKSARTDGGSKTLMHAFDRFEYTDLHEKKPIKFVHVAQILAAGL
mgnify:CR=1 FL=1